MVKTAMGADSGAPLRILVCDDERHIVRLIQVNLERRGHTVIPAFGGEEAIELLRLVELLEIPGFDVVVADVAMPNIDGFHVLKWIRSSATFQHLPVILLGTGGDRETFEAYHFGADQYLVKPFNPEELMGMFEG